jgi:hypothetical protein
MPYIFEVRRFYYEWNNYYQEINPKTCHLGFINKVFETKNEAINYCNKFNPCARQLNDCKTWIKGCELETRYLYILQEYSDESLTIPSFEDSFIYRDNRLHIFNK